MAILNTYIYINGHPVVSGVRFQTRRNIEISIFGIILYHFGLNVKD